MAPLTNPVAVTTPLDTRFPTLTLPMISAMLASNSLAKTFADVLIIPLVNKLPPTTFAVTLSWPVTVVFAKFAFVSTVRLPLVSKFPPWTLPDALITDEFTVPALTVVALAVLAFTMFTFAAPVAESIPVTAKVFWLITTTFAVLLTLLATFAFA